MSYTQDISRALKSGHRGGVFDQAFHEVLARTEPALEKLLALYASRTLPLLRLPEHVSDYPELKKAAAKLKKASDVVFLGTGGSSLGGQTLAQLAGYAVPGVGALRQGPRIHFMDNLDPLSFQALLDKLPLATAKFVAISKSGGTGETLMQTAAALSACTLFRISFSFPVRGSTARPRIRNPPSFLRHTPGFKGLGAIHTLHRLIHFCCSFMRSSSRRSRT